VIVHNYSEKYGFNTCFKTFEFVALVKSTSESQHIQTCKYAPCNQIQWFHSTCCFLPNYFNILKNFKLSKKHIF